MIPPFFCANFCEKNRYFWSKPIKQLDWRKKNKTIVNMIAKVFNHQLFWKKWESIKSWCTLFKKFNYFVNWFAVGLILVFPKLCFQHESWLCTTMRKKPTEAKKKKELNCFLWQVAFMQHFLTYVPHHYSKNCLLPFSPPKNEKLRLNSILEGLFSTLFIANKQF